MEDKRGLYYYPVPDNKRVRVYVRENEDREIEFRLWNQDRPDTWDRHGWLDMDIIRRAAELKGKNEDISRIYDVSTARFLIKEAKKG